MSKRGPWLGNPVYDSLFILLPPFYCLLVLLIFPAYFNQKEVSLVAWLVLVLGIDVAHVYSTLFRTYFNSSSRKKWRSLLVYTPMVAWLAAFFLYQFGEIMFWRAVAYLALFHFVRQQYGFFSLYARQEVTPKWERALNSFAIYGATLYPVLYWHFAADRTFSWFINGDFLIKPWPQLLPLLGGLYILVLFLYLLKEIKRSLDYGFNLPKNLLLVGTAFSWYAGIVWFNGDLIFTLFNVVCHGIPYIALVWLYSQPKEPKPLKHMVGYLLIFLCTIVVFAYLEEGLWDGLVWQEHNSIFPIASVLEAVKLPWVLSIIVPLLAVPQLTHYILDGFIWRKEKQHSA